MQCNLIGAGRLGISLLFALKKIKKFNFFSICNESFQNALEIIQDYENMNACANVKALPPADLTIITSPDDILVHIVKILSEEKKLCKNSMVVHCSGVLDSHILAPLKEQGCFVASIHPVKSFVGLKDEYAFLGVPCVLEGDKEACNMLQPIFESMGAEVISIEAAQKPLYHAACVMASNYVVTLAHSAVSLMKQSNIPENQAKHLVKGLIAGTLSNLEGNNPESILTGPLVRGDCNTIAMHLQSLNMFPEQKALYQAAGLASLPLTQLDAERQTKMKELFIEGL